MAPRTRRTNRKRDLRVRTKPPGLSTGNAFGGKSSIVGDGNSSKISNNAMRSGGGGSNGTSEHHDRALESAAKSPVETHITSKNHMVLPHIQQQSQQQHHQQLDRAKEEDPECPPDCKCLFRGRGFFLPANLEEEAVFSSTNSRS